MVRARGGRVTTSRRLLVEALFSGGSHRTAEELAATVQDLAPDVHLSTIYRNLDELERLGVVIHAHLGHGPATYHLATEMHGHLVCETCGQMVEVDEDLFGPLADELRRRYGFAVNARHFALVGRCSACTSPPRGAG